jgi:hypothetical protein
MSAGGVLAGGKPSAVGGLRLEAKRIRFEIAPFRDLSLEATNFFASNLKSKAKRSSNSRRLWTISTNITILTI